MKRIYPWLRAASLAFLLLAGGCGWVQGLLGETEKIPEEASQVVLVQANDYFTSPYKGADPFDQPPDIHIQQAWRGKDGEEYQGSPELWCLELSVTGLRDSQEVTESSTWIAVADENGSKWVAAALVTISSSWPYERCGKLPGDVH